MTIAALINHSSSFEPMVQYIVLIGIVSGQFEPTGPKELKFDSDFLHVLVKAKVFLHQSALKIATLS